MCSSSCATTPAIPTCSCRRRTALGRHTTTGVAPEATVPRNSRRKSSYNRPFTTRTAEDGVGIKSWVFNAEYPMVRWLESNGYDISYASSIDSDRAGERLRDHKVFMSSGHDEYWSAAQRNAVEAARDSGVSLAMFSGGFGVEKIRWQKSIDGSGTPYRTMVSYKETFVNAKTDPSPLWTGFWRDPCFSPPSDAGRPENAITGSVAGGQLTTALTVGAEEGQLRLWRNTSVAALPAGTTATLTAGTVGYEEDFDVDNGFRPAGMIRLSTTSLAPYPSVYSTFYRAPSGALVFGAGTVQWAWGLEFHHDDGLSVPDPAMRQATVNLLADMGVQPRTPQPTISVADKSDDAQPPTATPTSTAAGTTVAVGSAVTVSGTAADAGGGRVGAVEVSVDGGSSWHGATGRSRWRYSWIPAAISTAHSP